MSRLSDEIDRFFPVQKRAPSRDELVKFDGFDELDKRSAYDSFGGKSSGEVLEAITGGVRGWRSTRLEEWAVLEPDAARYYLHPYLKAMLRQLDEPEPDVDFIANVFFEIEQSIKMNGPRLFNEVQRELILHIGRHVLEILENDARGRFDIGGEAIADNVRRASKALEDQL